MTSLVFDTGALSLLYADQQLRPYVDQINVGRAEGFVSSVTLSEFFYKTCQSLGRPVATLWAKQISERMQVLEADLELALKAGEEKCRNNRLSLADSYALALARRFRGTLLTTDSELAKSKDVSARLFKV